MWQGKWLIIPVFYTDALISFFSERKQAKEIDVESHDNVSPPLSKHAVFVFSSPDNTISV